MGFNFMDSHQASVFTVAIGVSILTALVHIVFAVSNLPRCSPLKAQSSLGYGGCRSRNLVSGYAPWWRGYGGDLLGNASLALESCDSDILHRKR